MTSTDWDESDIALLRDGGGRDPFARYRVPPELQSSPTISSGAITITPLSAIEKRSIRYLDPPLYQADSFHLLTGRKGMGKGTVLADTASRVTRGELGERRNVLWIGSEDSAAIDIRPRVEAAGGEVDRVWVVKDGWLQLPRDISALRAAIENVGDVGLLILDPISNHISGANSNAEVEVRDAISPLNQLADECKLMIFGVRHLTEKEAKSGVLAAILGSSAWVQTPRAVLAVARDTDEPEVSHIQVVAGNRLPPGSSGRMFRIDGVELPGLENEVTRAVWIGDSTKSVENMLGKSSSQHEPSKTAQAREVLLDILDDARRMESDALDRRVADEVGLKSRTVQNLRKPLSDEGLIRNEPIRDSGGQVTRWDVVRTDKPRQPS